ncbi:hypothetical protein LIER_40221 [Lithospermum erythrorhizon]|uniref:Uncharacterized protein n=1 Tax=Lithospermum erythrorhizon TaxID=34254 RepID=A0AAV3QU89_LITER
MHRSDLLMLLRRSFSKQNENQRKMMLVGYFDDSNSSTASQSASNPSPLQPSEYYSSPLSPLKRQMSQVSINPDEDTDFIILPLLVDSVKFVPRSMNSSSELENVDLVV